LVCHEEQWGVCGNVQSCSWFVRPSCWWRCVQCTKQLLLVNHPQRWSKWASCTEASELQFSCKHAHTFIIALRLLLLFWIFGIFWWDWWREEHSRLKKMADTPTAKNKNINFLPRTSGDGTFALKHNYFLTLHLRTSMDREVRISPRTRQKEATS
jgi:hypothetical protein